MDELEPASGAQGMVHELREIADVIERCPELAELPDAFDAAQRLAMDLDSLDFGLYGLDDE